MWYDVGPRWEANPEYTGSPGVHGFQKPRAIVPEVGTPEDSDESDRPHEGKLKNMRLYHSDAKEDNVITNLFQVLKLYALRKLHVHTIISISALHIYSIMWLTCLCVTSCWEIRQEWVWLWYQSGAMDAYEFISDLSMLIDWVWAILRTVELLKVLQVTWYD